MHRTDLERTTPPRVAIACGGTGGHLFPGLAVADSLQEQGAEVLLLVSPKEVDQQGVRAALVEDVVTLPAVGLSGRRVAPFLSGFWQSFRQCRCQFQVRKPDAVLAMGGFTSAPPIVAAKLAGCATFIHEANSIPGRANRWLAPLVDEAFVGFAQAGRRLCQERVYWTGTPVRREFRAADARACRMALGLDPERPVVLVMGGSQGARKINELMARGAEILSRRAPRFQIIHLTGPDDRAKVREQYFRHELRAVVLPFLTEMELALGAATVAVSRAGASSLAELAAMRLPSVLIPYPTAADNHQYFNARAYARTGAARLFEQRSATPEALVAALIEMALEGGVRSRAQAALKAWYAPEAAARVRDAMLDHLQRRALLGRRGRLDTGRADRASSLRRSGRGERFDANGCAPWDRETTGLGVQASAGADWDFESGDR